MAERGFITRVLPVAALFAALVRTYSATPITRWTDTAVVESTIREAVARAPADLLLAATHSDDHIDMGDGKHALGYHHKSSKAGDDGYQTFDSFHTKTGDKYGYQKHSSFGKSKAGKKKGAYHDVHGEASAPHEDVEMLPGAERKAFTGPRFQSLADVSGDAFTPESKKQRRQLHDDDGDLFFVFTGDHYTAADGESDGSEGGEGEAAEQQEGHDGEGQEEHVEDDGSAEAQEQQEADDDGSEEDSGQQKKEAEAEDYDY